MKVDPNDSFYREAMALVMMLETVAKEHGFNSLDELVDNCPAGNKELLDIANERLENFRQLQKLMTKI